MGVEGALKQVLVVHGVGGQGTREIPLPVESSYWDWSPDGTTLVGFTGGIPDSMLIVDVASGATRMLGLQCGSKCEFAAEMVVTGPEWPWAAVTSEVDTWIVNLETGALRHLASNTWGVVGWRGPWVFFYRTTGQTTRPTPVMYRIPAAGGPEEAVLEVPAACGTLPEFAFSRDGTSFSCSAVSERNDVWVYDQVDGTP
jgi:hypothetical protein